MRRDAEGCGGMPGMGCFWTLIISRWRLFFLAFTSLSRSVYEYCMAVTGYLQCAAKLLPETSLLCQAARAQIIGLFALASSGVLCTQHPPPTTGLVISAYMAKARYCTVDHFTPWFGILKRSHAVKHNNRKDCMQDVMHNAGTRHRVLSQHTATCNASCRLRGCSNVMSVKDIHVMCCDLVAQW